MNVAEVISRLREEVLDDALIPYLWSDAELISKLNDTINELAEDNLVIIDQDTPSVTRVKLLSNQTLHPISDAIVTMRSGRLASTEDVLEKTTEGWLDANMGEWRTITGSGPSYFAPSASRGYLSIYPRYDEEGVYTGDNSIDFDAITQTVSLVGGNFSYLLAGDEIYISNTTDNNGFFTVASSTAGTIVVNQAVTNEYGTDAVIRKVRDTLILSVNRIPLAPFTVADITAATEITDIKTLHHAKLLNGIAKRAFLKPDSETYDKGKAEYHRGLFEIDKKLIKKSLILFHKPDRACTIRSGGGMGN